MKTTIELIKELRARTNTGLSDCKKALMESNNNIEEAVIYLQKKGLAVTGTKESRIATDGLIFLNNTKDGGYLLELNCETDFVTRNDHFQQLVSKIGKNLEESQIADLEQFLNFKAENEQFTIKDMINLAISLVGEKISLRRTAVLKSNNDYIIVHYIHGAVKPNMGRIGVLLKLKTTNRSESLQKFGKEVAMQIAAMKAEVIDFKNLNTERLQTLKESFLNKASSSGKPANVIEKMTEGMMKKFCSEAVLLDQPFILDNSLTVKQALEALAKEVQCPIEISEFIRYEVGEGMKDKLQN